MKIEEIKKSITFTEHPQENGEMRIVATLQLGADHYVSAPVTENPNIKEIIHDELRELIMRVLFDDHRREINKALYAFTTCDPNDTKALSDARVNLIKAAQYCPK